MKAHKTITALILTALVSVCCTAEFDKINRKGYQVDSEELQREGYIIGSTLKGLQGLVVPTAEHLYQFVEALAAGPYAGYFGATVAWTDKFETYNPPVDWQTRPSPMSSRGPIPTTATSSPPPTIRWHRLSRNSSVSA